MSITVADTTLVQTVEGYRTEVSNRWNEKRTITINRRWQLRLADGTLIGHIGYRMFTRERRSKGLRYVNARWQSPGWGYRSADTDYELEASSRKDAIERLVREWNRRNQ